MFQRSGLKMKISIVIIQKSRAKVKERLKAVHRLLQCMWNLWMCWRLSECKVCSSCFPFLRFIQKRGSKYNIIMGVWRIYVLKYIICIYTYIKTRIENSVKVTKYICVRTCRYCGFSYYLDIFIMNMLL